jgi:hypothetical protein
MPSSAGGFPWKADGDYRTLVYIKNETAVTRRYTASLVYPGGGYTLRPTEIRAGETVVVDFKKLRDEQVPDSVGNLIPLNLEKAQIGWSARGSENNVLSGRSEQISLSEGVASTYACSNCCSDVFITGWIEPFSATLGIGNNLIYTGKEIYANCYMQEYSPNLVWDVSWLSYSSSIATIDSFAGEAEGISPGDTWIEGSWTADQWTGVNGYCQYDPQPVAPSEPVEVPPCAWPTNFHQVGSGTDVGGGILRFRYEWESTTGNLAHLSACTVGEAVIYSGAAGSYSPPSPPFPNHSVPNPTIIQVAATGGVFFDEHRPGGSFVTPYSSSSWTTTTQYYQYSCLCIDGGLPQNIPFYGPIDIQRTVTPSGINWKYTVSKAGNYALIDPLP